jgi:hypothetical protein
MAAVEPVPAEVFDGRGCAMEATSGRSRMMGRSDM